MGASKIASIVLISVLLTAFLVAAVNVGVSIFLERPDYSDYCTPDMYSPDKGDINQVEIQACNDEYNKSTAAFNQIRFYIFAGLGFVLLLLGLFVPELITKVTGLATGGILVVQGLVMNFQNKWAVFISLLAIIIIFGYIGIRKVGGMK